MVADPRRGARPSAYPGGGLKARVSRERSVAGSDVGAGRRRASARGYGGRCRCGGWSGGWSGVRSSRRGVLDNQGYGGNRLFDHARQHRPFTAPIVIAHQRPHTLDDVRLGGDRIQQRRVAPALSPHRCLAVGGSRPSAVVILAVDAFFDVARRSGVGRARPRLVRSTRGCLDGFVRRRLAALAGCSCSHQGLPLKGWTGYSAPLGGAVSLVNAWRQARRTLRGPLPGTIEQRSEIAGAPGITGDRERRAQTQVACMGARGEDSASKGPWVVPGPARSWLQAAQARIAAASGAGTS